MPTDLRPQNVKQSPPKKGGFGNSFTRKRANGGKKKSSLRGKKLVEKEDKNRQPRFARGVSAWKVMGGKKGRKQLF